MCWEIVGLDTVASVRAHVCSFHCRTPPCMARPANAIEAGSRAAIYVSYEVILVKRERNVARYWHCQRSELWRY